MSKITLSNDELEEMCADFKALSDPGRMKIILFLLDGEKSVGEISSVVDMGQSATSHQLRILKDYRVVKNRKQGNTVFYRIADEHVKTIIEMSLSHLNCVGEE